jgi:hypothetical protein
LPGFGQDEAPRGRNPGPSTLQMISPTVSNATQPPGRGCHRCRNRDERERAVILAARARASARDMGRTPSGDRLNAMLTPISSIPSIPRPAILEVSRSVRKPPSSITHPHGAGGVSDVPGPSTKPRLLFVRMVNNRVGVIHRLVGAEIQQEAEVGSECRLSDAVAALAATHVVSLALV